MSDLQDLIDRAAAGEEIPGMLIYWDSLPEDHGAPPVSGPAFRYRYGDVGDEDSGILEFTGWGGPTDGSEDDTYGLGEYFGADGAYLGPDQHGIYPVFRV